MKKSIFLAVFVALWSAAFFSCTKKAEKSKNPLENSDLPVVKDHDWYYFDESGFKKIDLPQNTPEVFQKPWTESVRISSASSAVSSSDGKKIPFQAFALVNKKGLLCFSDDQIQLFQDDSIFSAETAGSLVFSGGIPVFYFYRSSFFSDSDGSAEIIHDSRPFLVKFNADSRIFFPLVSYKNLNLDESDQITGFFWNGETWACSAKKILNEGVEFSFFYWQPLVDLAELSPALGQETFLFRPLTEEKYKELNLPKLFAESPRELQTLLSSIPKEFSFYVSWRDLSGTSPVSYCQIGNGDNPLSAFAGVSFPPKYSSAVFSDGTVFIRNIFGDEKTKAFRLPLLPKGFSYGESAIAGDTLYTAWEESSFFKTGRAGFISVNLKEVLNQ